jgi:hypothetical protein
MIVCTTLVCSDHFKKYLVPAFCPVVFVCTFDRASLTALSDSAAFRTNSPIEIPLGFAARISRTVSTNAAFSSGERRFLVGFAPFASE